MIVVMWMDEFGATWYQYSVSIFSLEVVTDVNVCNYPKPFNIQKAFYFKNQITLCSHQICWTKIFGWETWVTLGSCPQSLICRVYSLGATPYRD
jgi:hypothetical protein